MNRLIPVVTIFLLFCLCTNLSLASSHSVNTDNLAKDGISPKNSEPIKVFRNFKSLEKYDTPVIKNKKQKPKLKEEGFQFNSVDSLLNKKWLDMATNTFNAIEQANNYIDVLTKDGLGVLPVAIRPIEVSNVKYTMGIAKAVFKPAYTELIVFLKVDTPRGTLILGADNIKLSHEGGIIGDAKLNLISQFRMNINDGKLIVTLKGSFETPATYATIDCSGFKELTIDADVKFSDELLFPVNKAGKKKLGYVEGSFKTVASDWNDIIVNVSLPEFGVKGLEGTTFKLNTAVLDFSDLRNDEAVPQEYINTYYANAPDLWRGVYVESLEVILPKAFKKRNNDKRVSFSGTKMIIDDAGVTGTFEANNILSIDEGSASKWQFSLDYFKVGLQRNAIIEGEFNGEMILPVSKVGRLKYNAFIRPDEYTFQVSKTEGLDFDVWNANVYLTPDSFIEMTIRDDEFRPKATLHGAVSIASGLKENNDDSVADKDKTVNFKGIVFEKMVIQTEAPKFSVEYFGYQGKQKLANFPVSLNEVGLRLKGGNVAELVFDISINLTSEGDGGNGGGSKLSIKAKLEEDNGRERWKYDGIDLERLFIKMEVAGLELKGAIFIFEDDPKYEKGFAGAVGAKYPVGNGFEVEAKVLFGRTDTFRYWYTDAQVTLPTPIPIFSVFGINSFGGGFYNRMKMAGIDRSANGAYENIGTSISGVIYEPSETNGFGMKASLGLILISGESLFNATVEFGIAFRRSGGIQEIYFKGEGNILSSIPSDYYERLTEKLGKLSEGYETMLASYKPEGRIAANVFIKHDFENGIFHATSELYINLGFLKGVGPNGRAGWLDFYSGPDDWHMLIGTPDDPIGTKLDIGILKEETRAYFMTGTDLPGSPPPPPMVAKLLGVDAAKLDYMRDLNKLDSGRGMALGMHWAMTTGDLKFLIFYARFDAGFGFDIMLKDYGDAHCKGSSKSIGMDGWYANGQAYAYLQGKVGIKVKIFGKRKKFTIFSGSGAILMQARLPNPTWVKGYFRGRYKILGGAIKGSFRFKVTVGKKCEVVGESVLEGIVVIGDIVPKEGESEIDVFAAPQVVFNLPINKAFELPDDKGDHKYKIMFDKFELSKDGKVLDGELEWVEGNESVLFYSHDLLPANSELKVTVQIHFEEYVKGKWEVIKDNGQTAVELKEVTFTTGEAPKDIPLSNVTYMYPVLGQKNFYPKEYKYGYVQLNRGQPYLFEGLDGWSKSMILKSSTGTQIVKTFTYSQAKKQLVFEMPKQTEFDQEYELGIMLLPPGNNGQSSLTESYVKKSLGDDSEQGNDVEIRSKSIDKLSVKEEERELLTYNFSTSVYKTFKDKIKDMKKLQDLYKDLSVFELILIHDVEIQEPFDIVELVGTRYSGNLPLISPKALIDEDYFKKDIYPLLYESYPLLGTIVVNREVNNLGVPPIRGVEPMTSYVSYLENEADSFISNYNPYSYNLTHYYYQDYLDLRTGLILMDDPVLLRRHENLVFETFPLMRYGDYKTSLQYVLPGQVQKSKAQTIKFFNPKHKID